MAAQQGSQDLSPISQVHNLNCSALSSNVARALVTNCQGAQHVLAGGQLHVSLHDSQVLCCPVVLLACSNI